MPRPEWLVFFWCCIFEFICCFLGRNYMDFFEHLLLHAACSSSILFFEMCSFQTHGQDEENPEGTNDAEAYRRSLTVLTSVVGLHLQDGQTKGIKAKKKAENAKARVVCGYLVLFDVFWGATIWISSSICCCIQLAPQAFFSLKFVVSRRTDRTKRIRRGPTMLRPPRDLSLSWHL